MMFHQCNTDICQKIFRFIFFLTWSASSCFTPPPPCRRSGPCCQKCFQPMPVKCTSPPHPTPPHPSSGTNNQMVSRVKGSGRVIETFSNPPMGFRAGWRFGCCGPSPLPALSFGLTLDNFMVADLWGGVKLLMKYQLCCRSLCKIVQKEQRKQDRNNKRNGAQQHGQTTQLGVTRCFLLCVRTHRFVRLCCSTQMQNFHPSIEWNRRWNKSNQNILLCVGRHLSSLLLYNCCTCVIVTSHQRRDR